MLSKTTTTTKNKTIEQINETRSCFFERINKIDKPLASLTKKKKERTQMNKIKNERGKITTNTAKVKIINKIDKTLARFIKKRKERIQIDKIMNERGEITANTTEMQTIIK